jgi:hypothetical protein
MLLPQRSGGSSFVSQFWRIGITLATDTGVYLNDDINQLERFLNSGAQDLISFFARVCAVGISFVLLAPGIAGWAMVPIPFILWGTFLFQSRLPPRYDTVRDQAGLISVHVVYA